MRIGFEEEGHLALSYSREQNDSSDREWDLKSQSHERTLTTIHHDRQPLLSSFSRAPAKGVGNYKICRIL
jgi:hypothetical protein